MSEPKTPNYDNYKEAVKCARHPLVREMCKKRELLIRKFPCLRGRNGRS